MEGKKIDSMVKKVVQEVLKEMDFDLEELLDSGKKDIEELILTIVMSLLDEEEIPVMDMFYVVEDEDVAALTNDDGEFILN
jgi:hypothetical protein